MVENLLMTDEEVEEKIDYRPYFTLGDVSLFPVPFTGAEYYLTDRRVLKKGKTIGNRERKDVPLEEIITIDYTRHMRTDVLLIGVIIALVGLILVPTIDYVIGSVITISGVLWMLYAVLSRRSQFVIQTSNPEASIVFPASRKNQEAQSFVQKVRESATSE